MKNILKVLVVAGSLLGHSQVMAQNELSIEQLLPQYIAWATKIEQAGQINGKPLDEKGLALAREIGIKAPEKVRLVYVDEVPFPYENTALKIMGEAVSFIGNGIVSDAQAFGYSIYVRKDFKLNKPLLAHELVHVLQIERASLQEVVIKHAMDLPKYGYKNSPLEAEAFKANKKYAIK